MKTPLPSPVNVSLTVNERDVIDAAKCRLRQLVILLPLLDSPNVTRGEAMAVLGELGDIMRESVGRLDAVFVAADQRYGTGGVQ